jgi:Flp pilus assembly pilin Flp
MYYLARLASHLLRDEAGQDLIEYALVAALIGLGAAATMRVCHTHLPRWLGFCMWPGCRSGVLHGRVHMASLRVRPCHHLAVTHSYKSANLC